MNTNQPEETLEEIEQKFVMEWHQGARPQLVDYINRHPGFASELTDFIMNFTEMKHWTDDSTDELTGVEVSAIRRGMIAALATSSSLKERLAEIGSTTPEFTQAVNVPPAITVMLLKQTITDIPNKLVDRAARFLNLGLEQTIGILAARPPQGNYSYLRKASSGTTGFIPQLRTFEEAIQECKRTGHLTADQEADWLVEVA